MEEGFYDLDDLVRELKRLNANLEKTNSKKEKH